MRTGMIAFSAGALAMALAPGLPDWRWCLVLASILLCCGFSSRGCRWRLSRWVLTTAGAGLLGVGWHSWWGEQLLSRQLPLALEGQDILVIGKVTSLPELSGRAWQFTLDTERSSAEFSPRRILLNYYGAHSISPGQRWQFRVRLNRIHGFYNPGGFDYEAWLLQQRIHGKGYVRDSSYNLLLHPGEPGFTRLRYQIREHLGPMLAPLRHGGIILALALGDRSRIDKDSWDLYTQTGTNHLMVVSGLHISFVSGLGFLLLSTLWRCIPALCLVMPASLAGAGAALLLALAYSLLSGFALPAQRALVMVVVFILSRFLRTRIPVSVSLLAALVAVLLWNPLAGLSAGFWLSFGAVAALLFVFSGRRDTSSSISWQRFWIRYIKPQWVVFIALLLPLSVWTQQLPLLSPLANFLAVPLVSLVVVPLCLIGAMLAWQLPELAQLLFVAADVLLEYLRLFLECLASPGGMPKPLPVSTPPTWVMLLSLAGSFLVLLPTCLRDKLIGLVLCGTLLFPKARTGPESGFILQVLDVGQGLAVILRTRNHTLVYDTGPRFSADFDAGSAVVLPVLRHLGVSHLDSLVISHGDNDHAGGATGLLGQLPVDDILVSHDVDFVTGAGLCMTGQQWRWDGVDFRVLAPQLGAGLSGNDSSCVVQVSSGPHAVLLPGDIEAAAETALVAQWGEALHSTILVAPHHGSNTSSSAAFIQAVDAEFVVFSAGYRNQFNHPAAAVQTRYARAGALASFTATQGMLSFTVHPGQAVMPPQAYRKGRPRYWH